MKKIGENEPKANVDLEWVRQKYREERDKRLRPDGDQQYYQVSGKFAHYFTDDPYAEPQERSPVSEVVEVAIIGGGFSGMLAAARLSEKGVDDFRIIEMGGDFGGTWYWNRYPGAQCDVDSYCYLPLLEETGYIPKEKYSYGTEIYEHSRRIGEQYGLYEKAYFQTRVIKIEWLEGEKLWRISTDRDDDLKARFIVMALGTATRAKLPGIEGIEEFEGKSFHTSRWDYSYTGGDLTGNLEKLADKKVAIIGTGATAIQCVPFVGESAERLYVFQRTPSSVGPRGNKPTDPEWVEKLQPGWQRERRDNFNDVLSGQPVTEDLVADGWTEIFRKVQAVGVPGSHVEQNTLTDQADIIELADFEKMEEIRQRVDETVRDPATAEALKPWYRMFCKRPTMNDQYLEAFNRQNVTLVDTTPSKGVQRITKHGVVANGQEFEVDCIIFATGFEITVSGFKKGIGFEILGRGGRSLYDHWDQGHRTLHGHSTHGFPNWFYIGISQNGLSANMTAMFDEQAQHIAYIISEVKARGAQVVEVTAEAEAKWVQTIRDLAVDTHEFFEACTPGYYNNEGKGRGGLAVESYAPGINAFNALLADWRAQGNLEGMELSQVASADESKEQDA